MDFTQGEQVELFSRNGRLEFPNGQIFHLKGINWFGMESDISALHGLWSKSVSFFVQFIKQSNFNFVRIPFSAEFALNPDSIQPGGMNYGANPELQNKSAGQVLDYVILALRNAGILVLLDLHTTKAGGPIDELWYDSQVPESAVINAWCNIVQRYKNQHAWNVVACGLNNEPHGEANWGCGGRTDWRQGAERIASEIHKINTRLLIFVEGVEKNVCVRVSRGSWWGGCLTGVREADIRLTLKDKLVYSPHCYGPDVSMQPYFSSGDLSGMPAIWEEDFGFLKGQNRGPALSLGEFGGKAIEETLDRKLQLAFVDWLVQKDLRDNFYWCLNPNSGDTQGILGDDWTTPNTWKLDLLNRMQPNPTQIMVQANGLIKFENGQHTQQPQQQQQQQPQPPQQQQSRDFNQDRSGTSDRGFGGSAQFEKKVKNSWQSNGVTSYDVDIWVVNESSRPFSDLQIDLYPQGNIQQVWNLDLQKQENQHSIYHLPSWLVNNGGLKAREKHSFGGIFTREVPKISVYGEGKQAQQSNDYNNGNQQVDQYTCQAPHNTNDPPFQPYNQHQNAGFQPPMYGAPVAIGQQNQHKPQQNYQQQQQSSQGPVYIPNSPDNEYHRPPQNQGNHPQNQGSYPEMQNYQQQSNANPAIQNLQQGNSYPSIYGEQGGPNQNQESLEETYKENTEGGFKYGSMYEQDTNALI